MTQPQLVMEYCKENGSITPAKLVTRAWGGGWFGSELPRVCRKLREEGKLESHRDGQFETFFLPRQFRNPTSMGAEEFLKKFPSKPVEVKEQERDLFHW